MANYRTTGPLVGCLLAASLHLAANAQVRDSKCATGSAEAYLDVNNVRARLMNGGLLFWQNQQPVYEVPKGSGVNSLNSASLWLSGTINDSLRVVAEWYRPALWPGPLTDVGTAPVDCAAYDRIWTVDRDMVERFDRTGLADHVLADWPTGLGAPTLDATGRLIDPMSWPFVERVDRLIDLENGERPHLLGDQMHWWVMNDVAGVDTLRDTDPIGVEIQMTAFAFQGAGAISNTTFYRLQLRKPGGSPLEMAHLGLYADIQLGWWDDNYVGSDSALGLAYTYNADNFDEREGYGSAPPAQGFDFLRGPLVDVDGVDNDHDQLIDEDGERLGMTSAAFVNNDRGGAEAIHYRLQGLLWDGLPITRGGSGRYGFSEVPTKWMYSGNPPEYWSELNVDGNGTQSHPTWRTLLSGVGPFVLSSDQPQDILIALITSFGSDNLDSVRQLKIDDAFIQNLVNLGLLDPPTIREADPEQYDLAASFFPIPASERIALRYSVPSEMHVRIEVFDILGRRQEVLVDAAQASGAFTETIDVSTWKPGVYIARLAMGHRTFARKLMVVR